MNKKEGAYHIPALLDESLDGLAVRLSGIYVDVTLGGGGHSLGILNRLGDEGRLYGFDQDADAEANIPDDHRFVFIRSNFRYLSNFLRYHSILQVDGILADLGVSSHHFDNEARGFSFRFDRTLDMRMNNRAGQTAFDILNTYPEEKLSDLLHHYGELKEARKIASLIVRSRDVQPILSSGTLIELLQPFVRKGKDEMNALREMLQQALEVLKPGGRLVIITYHSLEDRLVKHFMRSGNFEGESQQDFFGNRLSPFLLINNKVITPSKTEIDKNPRVRSAKLRIAEKK